MFFFIFLLLQFTDIDAAYTPTDYVLTSLLHAYQGKPSPLQPMHASSCSWISVTNADNVYGSEVIARVRHPPTIPSSTSSMRANTIPDMILTPLDSRNFADQGK
jgi:hypothetical protein